MNIPVVGVEVSVSVEIVVRGVVLARTGPIGSAKHQSSGVWKYNAVHLALDPVTSYNNDGR